MTFSLGLAAMTTLPLLDYAEACRLRDNGLSAALFSNLSDSEWLKLARQKAFDIAKSSGSVDINQVYAACGLPANKNSAGSVFRDRRFVFLGVTNSARITRHAGRITVWGLRE